MTSLPLHFHAQGGIARGSGVKTGAQVGPGGWAGLQSSTGALPLHVRMKSMTMPQFAHPPTTPVSSHAFCQKQYSAFLLNDLLPVISRDIQESEDVTAGRRSISEHNEFRFRFAAIHRIPVLISPAPITLISAILRRPARRNRRSGAHRIGHWSLTWRRTALGCIRLSAPRIRPRSIH